MLIVVGTFYISRFYISCFIFCVFLSILLNCVKVCDCHTFNKRLLTYLDDVWNYIGIYVQVLTELGTEFHLSGDMYVVQSVPHIPDKLSMFWADAGVNKRTTMMSRVVGIVNCAADRRRRCRLLGSRRNSDRWTRRWCCCRSHAHYSRRCQPHTRRCLHHPTPHTACSQPPPRFTRSTSINTHLIVIINCPESRA